MKIVSIGGSEYPRIGLFKGRFKTLLEHNIFSNNLSFFFFPKSEVNEFLRALRWCKGSHRFNAISRFFMKGERSGSLLESEFMNREKLNKKRKKHNYPVTNIKY